MSEIYTQKDFDSTNYDITRPTYPESLFRAITSYHRGPLDLAIDIGCGPGTASFQLLNHGVKKVIATDVSGVMIQPGVQRTEREHLTERIKFMVAPAEDLSEAAPGDESADLMISAEAIHYVEHDIFFQEAARVLRPGATLAFWAYNEPFFVDHPKANEIYNKYVFEDPNLLGPCWSQPGRHIVRSFYNDICVPEGLFESVEKHDYIPMNNNEHTDFFMGNDHFTLEYFAKNISTWSGVHKWRKQNPESQNDIIDMFIDELKAELGWEDPTAPIKVEYGTTYVLSRRR